MFLIYLCLLGVMVLTICSAYITFYCFKFILDTKVGDKPLEYIIAFLMSGVFGVLTLFFLELVWITLQVIFN